MTVNVSIGLGGDVKAFLMFLDSTRFRGNLDREMRRATLKSALMMVKIIKKEISQGKGFTKNAKLTRALKRSNRPLVDELNLRDAINFQLMDSFRAEVGVVDNRLSTGSKAGKNRTLLEVTKLVELMESGYTIQVTQAMITALMARLESDDTPAGKRDRALAGIAKNALRGKSSATWRVPPRKVLTSMWSRKDIQDQLRTNWREALERAFKKQGAK